MGGGVEEGEEWEEGGKEEWEEEGEEGEEEECIWWRGVCVPGALWVV